MPDAMGTFPYLVVLGFGMVWMLFSTLAFMWVATWRSNRAPHVAAVRQSAAMTRRRAGMLLVAGSIGGVVLGAAAVAWSLSGGASDRPRGGAVGP